MSSAILRCHLRVVRAGRRELHALTPRPLDGLRVSTNFYHSTWHLITAPHHASTIRRLLWALSFDLHPDTAIVLDSPLVVPTPFDAARSPPVVFACSERAHLSEDDVRSLVHAVRKQRSDRTVKLQTFGLSELDAIADVERRATLARLRRECSDRDLRVELRGGAILFSMSAKLLQLHAMRLAHLEGPLRADESTQEYFGDGWPPAGELQVFGDYPDMLRDARLARETTEARADVARMPPSVLSDVVAERRTELTLARHERDERRRRQRSGSASVFGM